MIKKIKEHSLALFGYLLIWGTPLFYIGLIALTINVDQHKWLIFELWSLFALFIMIFIYIGKLRRIIRERLLIHRIRDNFVPAIWRFLQAIEYVISMGIAIFAIDIINKIGQSIFSFLIIVLVSGVVGFCFLMLDSLSKQNQNIQ